MVKIPDEPHVQVNFRMPASLRHRVGESAEINGRSVTAELVFLLERALGPDNLELAKLRDEFMREFAEFLAQKQLRPKD